MTDYAEIDGPAANTLKIRAGFYLSFLRDDGNSLTSQSLRSVFS